jgi:hypothetical protein
MKKLLVVLALLAVGSSVLVAARSGRDPAQRTLTIKVTSTNPNQEILFDASYIFQSGDSELQHVERVTPFEVSAKSDFVAGIFRKKSEGGNMLVQLSSSLDGETEALGNAGRADVVVLGTTSGDKFPYSVTGWSAK